MEEFGSVILLVIIIFVIILICRELNCWYLKINARISLMEQMLENQKEMIRLLKGEKGEPAKPEPMKQEEISNLDEWIQGKEARTDGTRVEDDEHFIVDAEVSSMVDKNGVQMGDIMKVTKVGKDHVICSLNGKNVGKFSTDEVFLIK